MASLADFSATVSADPYFSSAWGEVYGQLQKEGGDVSKINSAKIAFVDSFQQLSSQGFGLSGTSAIDAAKAYVMAGQTAVGAIGMVSGLVNTVSSGTPIQVVQAFSGTMIGATIAAGALSAGVGAAIVGGVAVVLQMLQSTGLIGSPPPTTKICADVTLTWVPSFVVGCVAFDVGPNTGPAQIAPGSTLWRSFPSDSDPQDAGWYAPTKRWMALWRGIGVTSAKDNVQAPFRPIDRAFPNFARIETDAKLSTAIGILRALGAPIPSSYDPKFADFYKAFFAAWKSNAEFGFNGLKAQPDETVLVHTLRMWNRAHQGPSAPLTGTSYAASLTQAALASVRGDDPIVSGGQIVVNLGPLAAPAAAIASAVAPPVKLSVGKVVLPTTVRLSMGPVALSDRPASPATLAAIFAAANMKPARPWLPYVPAALGVAASPWLGVPAAVVGAFASLVWKIAKR